MRPPLFKDFLACKENPEDGKPGDRYKSDSYPPIRRISHAVSLDEKRSKFRLLEVCDPIRDDQTDVVQVWFPGAHADVGGGYSDSRLMSGISLNWMISELARTYLPAAAYPRMPESATALAHWSMGDRPANAGSDCENRRMRLPRNERLFPERAVRQEFEHESVGHRRAAGEVPIRGNFYRSGMDRQTNGSRYYLLKYPIDCPGPDERDLGDTISSAKLMD